MDKTIFRITGMDCSSEEQIIRMKLSEFQFIKNLLFDLTNRNLTVIHNGNLEKINLTLNSLNLGTTVIETGKITGEISTENQNEKKDRGLLWKVLIINFSFFILETLFGIIANSMGLMADSLDMLADAFVYGLSIYAISGTQITRKRIAGISGIFQLLLAILGFVEVIRRFIGNGELPNSMIMIGISMLALFANYTSLIILNKSKSKEVHIRSSQIFTSNDIIANIGVIIAGILVFLLSSKIPDLIIGTSVFILVMRGAIRILRLSK